MTEWIKFRSGGSIMESAGLGIIVFVLMSCFYISCFTNCIWYFIFGIIFLIILAVVLFVRGYFDGDFTFWVILSFVVLLVSVFIFIWVYDEWDLLYPLTIWRE